MSRMTTDLFDITELAHHGPETVIQASLTIAGAIVILADPLGAGADIVSSAAGAARGRDAAAAAAPGAIWT